MERSIKVIVLIGLPGAGKSYWAKEYMKKNDNFIRVSRDDFRMMLKNQPVCEPNIEKLISSLVENTIMQGLKNKQNIIVDNTHLRTSYINDIIKLVEYSADVEFMLFDVPLQKCIERDRLRSKTVGESVITDMNKSFLILKDTFHFQNQKRKPFYTKPIIKPLFKHHLPHAVIFDIDGTIAHMKDRGPFDWDKVFKDDVNEIVVEQIKFHKSLGRKIILLSGRDEVCRQETKEWLDLYNIDYDRLYMREKEDRRKDTIIKKEVYENKIKDFFNIICVYDDRLDVLKTWETLGIFSFNVNQGNILF